MRCASPSGANFGEFTFRDCMKKPQVRANRLSMRRPMAAYTRTPRWLHTASRSPCSSFCCERSREMSVPPPSGVGGPEMLAVAEASANLDYLAFLGQFLRPTHQSTSSGAFVRTFDQLHTPS